MMQSKTGELIALGKRIHFLRKQNGMTLQELADKCGYTSRASISKIEKGEIDIPISKVDLFAKAFDVSPLVIMGIDDRIDRFAAYSERLEQISDKDRERALKMIDSIIKGFEDVY